MKSILLLHLDGKLPNVALMRLGAHHEALGDIAELRFVRSPQDLEPRFGDCFDQVYASVIFSKTIWLARQVLRVHPRAVLGGPGWPDGTSLEDLGVTTQAHNYSLYTSFKESIGFTQRGCRMRCDFCVVPRMEGAVSPGQTIAEIWRGGRAPRKVMLFDNDFFGGHAWPERVKELRDGKFSVCLCQGINLRLLTAQQALALASLNYRDTRFKAKRIYAAWDAIEDERAVFRGLEHLKQAGVKPDHLMVYMLIGHAASESHEQRDYRRARLRYWGARPYPMPFTRTRQLVSFQRWVIGAYDKSISWKDWSAARGEPRNLVSSSQMSLLLDCASRANPEPPLKQENE